MNVSFTNLFKASQYGDKKFKKKIINGLSRLISKNQFIGGEQVNKFEKKFSKYININHCITVANGTDALEIAIESLELPKKSEVILTRIMQKKTDRIPVISRKNSGIRCLSFVRIRGRKWHSRQIVY